MIHLFFSIGNLSSVHFGEVHFVDVFLCQSVLFEDVL